MKERPIIFSTPMVQAILDGRKTMTRRVCKVQIEPVTEKHNIYGEGAAPCIQTKVAGTNGSYRIRDIFSFAEDECPYGKPGDRLWVKESAGAYQNNRELFGLSYRADVPDDKAALYRWRGSYFLRREDSRITLEITEVRVERLQDITWQDAIKEGLRVDGSTTGVLDKFHTLWDRINGKQHPWESNPWVWVISFKKI